ncbi:hypothetical protein [Teichococcus vastitatis]|uniref:Uncharacterized protein n=1 Tax=Teichococcus vastitatis TaxID=2307076 RepID=A0ABS9WED4_9PROT|nr:hypothetical protein [Pseudoroseomonas vastitatis]MCI0757080.1 hypothetical protein [Pseudoroseomonas vastitatis]
MMTRPTASGEQRKTCDDAATITRFTEREISQINRDVHSLPGSWTIFPHVDENGEVTLLLAPACWEDQDTALVLQRDVAGICVLLSVGDDVALQGMAPGVSAAMAMLWDCACRHTDSLAGLNWRASA